MVVAALAGSAPATAIAQVHASGVAPPLPYVERNLPPPFPQWRSAITIIQPDFRVVTAGNRVFVQSVLPRHRRHARRHAAHSTE